MLQVKFHVYVLSLSLYAHMEFRRYSDIRDIKFLKTQVLSHFNERRFHFSLASNPTGRYIYLTSGATPVFNVYD